MSNALDSAATSTRPPSVNVIPMKLRPWAKISSVRDRYRMGNAPNIFDYSLLTTGAGLAVADHDRHQAHQEDSGRPGDRAEHRRQHRAADGQTAHRVDGGGHRLIPDERLHPVRVLVHRHQPGAEEGADHADDLDRF